MIGLQFIFFILPVSVVLLLLWVITRKTIFGTALLLFWGILTLMIVVSWIIKPFYTKKVLTHDDYYGSYVIDRNYFSGKQADWQYNHYRFEIKENDSLYFYVTDGADILKTYKGKITTVTPYSSARLAIAMEIPSHHILTTNPTVYREVWDFFLVFNSPKYHNMYFRKGTWEAIE